MTTQLKRTSFDYNLRCPDKETRTYLRGEETAIRAAHRRIQNDIIETGQRLLDAKERIEHGLFMDWVEGALGYSYRHATGFMQVAQTFGKMELNSTLPLSQTALFALAAPSVSDETRAVAVEMALSGDLKNNADAKQLIEAGKAPKVEFNSTLNSTFKREIAQNDEDDFDDTDPFDDLDLQPEVGYFEPEADAEFNPGGLYDSDEDLPTIEVGAPATPSTPDAAPLDDEIDALPLAQALALYPHGGQMFKQQANLWHSCSSVIKAARAKGGYFRYTNERGPVTMAMKAIANLPSPDKWAGCGACKGSQRFGERRDPCESCGGLGFTIHENQGVSPDVVAEHAEEFIAQLVTV